MSSYGSIWVKPSNPNLDQAFIQDEYEMDSSTLAKDAFICLVSDCRDDRQNDYLEELSHTFGTAILLVVQTTVDLFSYGHWQQGQPIRELSYTADSGWYLVEGTPEAWEAELFSEPALEQTLANLESRDEELKGALQQYWHHKQLIAGQLHPRIFADELYMRLSQHFNLPNPA